MKRIVSLVLSVLLFISFGLCITGFKSEAKPGEQKELMYRLYNPYSGEHFYTKSGKEKNTLVSYGWEYEGTGWISPATGAPVYRLYNRNAGDHHYTMDAKERDRLVRAGWSYEGVAWNSADSQTGIPLYRLYNPNAVTGSHHYTTSSRERDNLVRTGWKYEGIGWYGCREEVYLSSLEYTQKTDWIKVGKKDNYEWAYDEELSTDVNGVEYDYSTLICPYSSYYGNTRPEHPCVTYYINKQYTKFSGILYRPYQSLHCTQSWVGSTSVLIYGDDVLLYEAPNFTQNTFDAVEFNIDVTGVRTLKIEMQGTWNLNDDDARLGGYYGFECLPRVCLAEAYLTE